MCTDEAKRNAANQQESAGTNAHTHVYIYTPVRAHTHTHTQTCTYTKCTDTFAYVCITMRSHVHKGMHTQLEIYKYTLPHHSFIVPDRGGFKVPDRWAQSS